LGVEKNRPTILPGIETRTRLGAYPGGRRDASVGLTASLTWGMKHGLVEIIEFALAFQESHRAAFQAADVVV